jgi:ubiquinone/menaquinone biosynthesis C-methylase UbiE
MTSYQNDSQQAKILKANQLVHAALATSGEYNKSPHFRQENQQKVKNILESIVSGISDEHIKLLDMGCGTGFIIHLAIDLVDEIHGIDITDEMMEKVDQTSGKVHLHNSLAEKTPFNDNSFSLVTAYSFLDHLESYRPVFEEAYRVLKPGGVFYSDLNPNKHFGKLMLNIEKESKSDLPAIVEREIISMLHNGNYYQENFGINSETLEMAEPLKTQDTGLDPDEMLAAAKEIGFSEVRCEYEWYLGQANVMHQQSFEDAAIVDNYLKAALPATRALFKYLRLVLKK